MGENTTVQPKVEVKNDEQRAKNFVAAYEKICEEHQLRIVTTPAWRVSQDTGDWRLVLQSSVGKLPKTE